MFCLAFRSKCLMKNISSSVFLMKNFSENDQIKKDQNFNNNEPNKNKEKVNLFKQIYEKADDPQYKKFKATFIKVLINFNIYIKSLSN